VNIDIHAHIIVPEITRAAAPDDAWRPHVEWGDNGQIIEFGGRRLNSALREFVDIETILVEQDKAGVDAIVLTPWSSLFGYDLDLDKAVQVNRIQNDGLAKIVAQHSPRVAALGTVALQDSDAAVAELERAVTELGLKGVEIGTNVNGVYLGDPQFRPFWEAAARLGAVVQIHPVPGVGGKINREYYLWNVFGNPAETALAAAHIIFSGVLEAYPNLKICLFHGGGHLPYQIGRLDRAYKVRRETQQHISAPPSTYLKRFYFDTVTHSPQALAYLIDLVGAGQVMMGSDYPFDMGYDQPTQIVKRLPNLSDDAREMILSRNARQLFGF